MKQYRADLPAWILFGGLSASPWLVVWASYPIKIDLTALAVAIASSAFAFAWLFSFRIVITPKELVFRSLFRGRRTLRHEEIKSVSLTWKWEAHKGPLGLVVEPRDGTTAKPLQINAKFFSREAIHAVLDLGARVGKSDDGGLRDGVVLRNLRCYRKRRKK